MPLKTGFLSVKGGLITNHWPKPLIHFSGIKQRIWNNHPGAVLAFDLRFDHWTMKPVQSYFLKLALQKSVLPCERILPSNRFSCFPSDSSIAALTNSVTGPMIWNAKYDICLVIRLHLFILFSIVFWKGGAPGIKTGSQNWEQKIFWESFYVSGPNLRYCLLYIPLWGGGIFVTPHPYWTVLHFCLFNIIDVFIFFTKLGEIVECGTTCTPVK